MAPRSPEGVKAFAALSAPCAHEVISAAGGRGTDIRPELERPAKSE